MARGGGGGGLRIAAAFIKSSPGGSAVVPSVGKAVSPAKPSPGIKQEMVPTTPHARDYQRSPVEESSPAETNREIRSGISFLPCNNEIVV